MKNLKTFKEFLNEDLKTHPTFATGMTDIVMDYEKLRKEVEKKGIESTIVDIFAANQTAILTAIEESIYNAGAERGINIERMIASHLKPEYGEWPIAFAVEIKKASGVFSNDVREKIPVDLPKLKGTWSSTVFEVAWDTRAANLIRVYMKAK